MITSATVITCTKIIVNTVLITIATVRLCRQIERDAHTIIAQLE